MLCLVALFVSQTSRAQWVVTDPGNLAQGIINATKNIVHTSSTASTMIQNFQETVKIYKQGKEYYDALKKVKNLVRDARKVQQTILLVGDITDIYVNSFERMLNDPYFTVEELSAIALGYTFLAMRYLFTSIMCLAMSMMLSISTNANCEYGSIGIIGPLKLISIYPLFLVVVIIEYLILKRKHIAEVARYARIYQSIIDDVGQFLFGLLYGVAVYILIVRHHHMRIIGCDVISEVFAPSDEILPFVLVKPFHGIAYLEEVGTYPFTPYQPVGYILPLGISVLWFLFFGKEVGAGTEEFSHIAIVGHLYPVALVLFPVQDMLRGYGNLGIVQIHIFHRLSV